MSSSRGFITCGKPSTRFTSFPASRKFSATSKPIKPPPTTVTLFTFLAATKASIFLISVTFFTTNTFSRSIPLIEAGKIALAPGESANLS